jgi:hypothetical protein
MLIHKGDNPMKKLLIAAALAVVPALAMAVPAFATSPGQLASGPDLYQVKNVTKGNAYGSTASATCGDVVKYSIKLANSEYGLLKNVTVKAPLTGTMTASATNAANQNTSVSGSVTVNVDKGNLVYVSGSTVNLNVSGGHIKNLADGITTSGVNKGDLNGSTREFVQFQAKVECETPPKNITVCELATKKIVTIKETDFDAAKHSKNLNDCKVTEPGKITVCETATKKVVTIKENEFDAAKHSKDLNDCAEVLGVETPEVIASTGPTSAIAIMFGLSALTAGIGYFVQRRRNLLG